MEGNEGGRARWGCRQLHRTAPFTFTSMPGVHIYPFPTLSPFLWLWVPFYSLLLLPVCHEAALVLKIFCFQEGSLLSLPQQENNITKCYKRGPVSNHGEMRWGDHLTISVCWEHQLMTFITNNLGPQAMNLDKLIKKEACWVLLLYKIEGVCVLMEKG